MSDATRKTVRIQEKIRPVLEDMADHAKMYWFVEEYMRRKTMPLDDVEALSCAFMADNLYGIADDDVIAIYDFFAANLPDQVHWFRKELAQRIREYDSEGYTV